mgnify:CR=1 FL=1
MPKPLEISLEAAEEITLQEMLSTPQSLHARARGCYSEDQPRAVRA